MYLKQIKISIFILLVFCLASLEANTKVIQVGAFSNIENVKNIEKKLEKFELYKQTTPQNITKVYVLNSNMKKIQELLFEVRVHVKDAFITSIVLNSVNPTQTLQEAIYIGSFSTQEELEKNKNIYKDYTLHTTQENGKFSLYITSNDLKRTLEQIKFFKHDAKIVNLGSSSPTIQEQKDIPQKDESSQELKEEMQQSAQELPKKEPVYYFKEPRVEETPPLLIGSEEEIELRYKAAVDLYKREQFEKAYTLFSSLRGTTIPQTRLEFYIGRCAYQLNKNLEALEAYNRVLKENPENLRVKLEIAQVYKRMRLFDEAQENFESVLKENIPQQVRQNIMLNIAQVEKLGQKNFFSSSLFTGVSYDSNILNETNQNSYDIYIPDFDTFVNVSSSEEKSSYMFDAGAAINHIYKNDSNFMLLNTLNVYGAYYPDYEEKNVDIISLQLQPTYFLSETTKAGVSFYMDNVWYGNENFINNFTISPKFSTKLQDYLTMNNALEFSYQKFIRDADSDKDLRSYALSSSFDLYTYGLGMFSTKASAGKTQRVRGVRSDIEKDFYSFSLLNRLKLSSNLEVVSKLNSEFNSYKFTDANFLNKRSDEKYLLGFDFNYHLMDSTTFTLGYQYINQSSNQAPFDYDKYTVKGSLIYNY